MSYTQRVVDELRELSDKIEIEAGQAARSGQMVRLERYAGRIRDLANDLGDD